MFSEILKFLRTTKANVAIEFVLIVPTMILLFSGIYELCNYILLHNKLVRTVGVVGDMISRQDLTRSTLTGYLKTAKDVLYPFDFNTNGSIVATQIQNVEMKKDPQKMKISWQENYNGATSKIGVPGSLPKNLPNNVSVIEDQTLIVTEVFYNYKPTLFENFFPQKTIYKIMVFVPRTGTMNKLIGE